MKQAGFVIRITDLKAFCEGHGCALGTSPITENKICFFLFPSSYDRPVFYWWQGILETLHTF